MDVEKLTEKFKREDNLWSIDALINWLVEKKGIPKEIAVSSVYVVLMQIEGGLEIDTHHGQNGFDNIVLKASRKYIEEGNKLTLKIVGKDIEEKIKKMTSGNRWSKALKALRGKI